MQADVVVEDKGVLGGDQNAVKVVWEEKYGMNEIFQGDEPSAF